MKKTLFTLFAFFYIFTLYAQTTFTTVEVGDILTINQPEDQNFKYLQVPRANFIIKKGGIADYKNLNGKKVKVTEVTEESSGELKVVLKRIDGRKFFNSYPVLTANFKGAIEAGELIN